MFEVQAMIIDRGEQIMLDQRVKNLAIARKFVAYGKQHYHLRLYRIINLKTGITVEKNIFQGRR